MKKILIALLLLPLAFSCATSTKTELAAEKAAVTDFEYSESVMERTQELLDKSKLTASQKARFLDLQSRTYTKVQNINNDIKKTKMVLFQNLFAEKYEERKVNALTRQLKKLNSQKLDAMFDAIAESRAILGRELEPIKAQELWHPTQL